MFPDITKRCCVKGAASSGKSPRRSVATYIKEQEMHKGVSYFVIIIVIAAVVPLIVSVYNEYTRSHLEKQIFNKHIKESITIMVNGDKAVANVTKISKIKNDRKRGICYYEADLVLYSDSHLKAIHNKEFGVVYSSSAADNPFSQARRSAHERVRTRQAEAVIGSTKCTIEAHRHKKDEVVLYIAFFLKDEAGNDKRFSYQIGETIS